MKKIVCAVVFWVIVGLVIFLVRADTTPPTGVVIEDHEGTAGSSYIGNYQGNLLKQAQQFYLDAGDQQPISGIGILLRDTDYGEPTGDITLALYENVSGNVPGGLMAGTERSFTPVLGEWNYITYTEGDIALNTGDDNKSWIVATLPAQSGDNGAYGWMRSGSNSYDRGYRKTYNLGGSGAWSGSQTGDFSFRIYGDASLSVIVSHFTVSVCDEAIVLNWTTESEVETVGFHVLRSESRDGPYIRINSVLIAAKGQGSQGASYSYKDDTVIAGCLYWYQIEEVASSGQGSLIGPVSASLELSRKNPDQYKLYGGFPNPFNPLTTIRYRVSGEKSISKMMLRIFSLTGRKVVTLTDKVHHPGDYSVNWNGCDGNGLEVSSGSYVVQLVSNGRIVDTGKIVKLK